MSTVATKPVLGWHFLRADGTMRNGEKPPRVGHYMRHTGKVDMCNFGLHFSRRAIDALDYARGPIVCRVRCRDIVDEHGEKAVCRERKILWRYDATDVLRAFARRCALDVIHLWDAPPVVQEYLETGDETSRDAARAAALAGARAAAGAAARATARDAQNDLLEKMLEAAR